MKGNARILFSCTGIGVINRGIESFFREAYDGLKNLDGIETKLLTSKKAKSTDEKKVFSLLRTSYAANLIGKITGRSSYAIEQVTSFPLIVSEIKKFKPHVIFSSEANLFFLLYRFRKQIGVPFKLLYSNGGPIGPIFNKMDYVHQVAPYYKQAAIKAGEPEAKHIMVPYGIHVPPEEFSISLEGQRLLRKKLHLPEQRKIVISVGWISSGHKRMDYTINEMASIPEQKRPFLLLLGSIDNASDEIFTLAKKQLRAEDYSIRSVSYKEVFQFYKVADIFVLSSLKEGFGRVYLEALMYNLPVIAHDHPVMQFVVGNEGILTDLEKPGNLSKIVVDLLESGKKFSNGRNYVRQKFDWKVLAPAYKEMFLRVALSSP
jgi:1,2-diacylglycerol 3-alpha-glucosyltransferase